ncbi:MAG TPA: hypothetical protein VK445_09910 [Dissulfurispiraceae bacterium]|nr:hypothetical protein [Dissulfurispiraceae bacterium]
MSRITSVDFECADFQAIRPLLVEGMQIAVRAGVPLLSILVDQLGISEEYVTQRISTIFLDGKPLDDILAVVREGSVVALSAALPGLVGATMRRDGLLASFRSGISFCGYDTDASVCEGMITLKLFNAVLDEVGPDLFERGVLVPATEYQRLAGLVSGIPGPNIVEGVYRISVKRWSCSERGVSLCCSEGHKAPAKKESTGTA